MGDVLLGKGTRESEEGLESARLGTWDRLIRTPESRSTRSNGPTCEATELWVVGDEPLAREHCEQ